MGRKIKGAAFDLEGTALSVEELHFEAYAQAAQFFEIKVTGEDILHMPGTIGAGDEGVIEIVLEQSKRSDVSSEEYRQRKIKMYQESLKKAEIRLRPGFVDFCTQLKERGLQMAIASLTPSDEALLLIRRTGLDKVFDKDKILLKEDVVNLKPAPDVFC